MLTDLSYTFDERDISDTIVADELMERHPDVKTIPQIFFSNGTYIGGCNDLLDLIMEDKLTELLELNTVKTEAS